MAMTAAIGGITTTIMVITVGIALIVLHLPTMRPDRPALCCPRRCLTEEDGPFPMAGRGRAGRIHPIQMDGVKTGAVLGGCKTVKSALF